MHLDFFEVYLWPSDVNTCVKLMMVNSRPISQNFVCPLISGGFILSLDRNLGQHYYVFVSNWRVA